MEISIINRSAEVSEPAVVSETVQLSRLDIREGGSLSAPEGHQLTLTVGGAECPIRPGVYEGDVVLTVTEDFPEIVDEYGNEKYRAALYVDEGGIDPDRSVLSAIQGGSCADGNVKNAALRSTGEGFTGLVYTAGEHEVENIDIAFTGNGYNDFAGVGTGIVATGTSKVHVRNADIRNEGVVRNAVLAADHGEIVVEDSRISCRGDDNFIPPKGHPLNRNMREVPWVLGISGTNRATNIVGSGRATYLGCDLQSDGWGVLSTDGVDSPENYGDTSVEMHVKDSRVAITGASGYGSYAIGATHNTYDHTEFEVPDYALICANEYAGASFVNGCRVRSRRFGILWHQNQGGLVEIRDSTFETGMATFLVKGCYPRIHVRDSEITAHNGVILQLMDTDDPILGGKEAVEIRDQTAVKDPDHKAEEPNYADLDIFSFHVQHVCTDLRASFENVALNGDFYNSTTNACKVGMVNPEGSKPPAPDMEGPDGDHMAPPPPPEMHSSSEAPVNLVLSFRSCTLNGKITASTAEHLAKTISPDTRSMFGIVENTPSRVVNNGVLVRLEGSSTWTVAGDCYLSYLSFNSESRILAPEGKNLLFLVDGEETPLAPGTYQGDLKLAVR